MGFAQLAITDIAAEYHLSVEDVFQYCDQLGITYKNQDTCLALEDAKAVIQQILSQNSQFSETNRDKV
jgi:hypothetical protein